MRNFNENIKYVLELISLSKKEGEMHFFKQWLLLALVFSFGSLLIMGCLPGVHGTTIRKPTTIESSNDSGLSPTQKHRVDELMDKREDLVMKRERKFDELTTLVNSGSKNPLVGMRIDKLTQRIDKLTSQITATNDAITTIRQESQQSCFPNTTQVLLSDGSFKSIDKIQNGDKVMVYDIAKNELDSSTVIQTLKSKNNHYYIINDSLKATAYERFLTSNGWKRAWEIEPNDTIFTGNSYENVRTKSKIHGNLDVYNLTVANSHNFFVSQDGHNILLVHNHGGGGGGGGK